MLREKHKRKPRECESTDAEHSGGSARSSEEVSVMEMERRGSIVRPEVEKTTGNGRIGLKQENPAYPETGWVSGYYGLVQ